MISESQQRIYNNHLVSYRKAKKEPFRLRKDFSKISDDTRIVLEKLDKFFNSHTNIDQDTFFKSPYIIFDDLPGYHLDFYITRRAISCYTQYIKKLELEDPDGDVMMARLIESLKFVFKFCKNKGLTFEMYQTYSEESLPCFLTHLKDHKIVFYTLHALTFGTPKIDSSILDFVIPDYYQTFQKTKNKFFNSIKMRAFSRKAKEQLDKQLC